MGYYIQTSGNFGKAAEIVGKFNGKIIPPPMTFANVPADKALICVVNNVLFEAAGFVYDEWEFNAFTQPTDTRPHTWLLIDRKEAEKQTNFTDPYATI